MSEISQNFFRTRLSQAGSVAQASFLFAAALAIAGCGSNLRPTVTPITGTGPAAQPLSGVFAMSVPLVTTGDAVPQGIGTAIDYSGDTVMATAPIGPNPITFALNGSGSEAWSLNVDGTLSNIPVSTQLQAKNVYYSTLNPLPSSGPFAKVDPIVGLFAGTQALFALDDNLNQLDVLTPQGNAYAFKLVVPVDETPVTMVGVSGTTRYYSISQMVPYSADCNVAPHSVGVNGMADGIETSTYSLPSSHIELGVCPVYAVGSPDSKRVFVLNRGSDTISVINSQNNAIDSCTCPPAGCVNQAGQTFSCHPSLPLSTSAGLAQDVNGDVPKVAGPVYAEYNAASGLLAVADYDGNTITLIDVSLDVYGNDSQTFGTTYTIPVGYSPASITVLADGSRAYVANQGGDAVNGTANGSVSIVNVSSHTVENGLKPLAVIGHPRTVVSTQNSSYGKVYVLSPDSPYITIIRTDQDIISTTVLLQGNGLDVRVTTPDTTSQNANIVSRLPGAGQPCFLPLSELPASSITIANCRYQDTTQLTTNQ